MDKLVSAQTMESIDNKAQTEYSIPGMLLMEQAGIKAWATLQDMLGKAGIQGKEILFIVGGGNNGGDALVMAREAASWGCTGFSLLLCGSRISTACATQRLICNSLGFPSFAYDDADGKLSEHAVRLIHGAHIIIDGLSGTGLRGPITTVVASLIGLVNQRKEEGALICAIDIPSGCSDNVNASCPHIHADITITMGLMKGACYHPACRPHCGQIVKVNPSFPTALLEQAPAMAYLYAPEDLKLPAIDAESYKNRRGHLALFAGSSRFSGASRLASRSAFHARAGLVTLCCDDSIASIAAVESPSVIVRSLQPGVVIGSEELRHGFQAIAAGPGWSGDRDLQLMEILHSSLPTVLDADALDRFASLVANHRIQMDDHGPLVLTPHPGELHRMLETLHMPLLAQETGPGSSPESFIDSLGHIAAILHAVVVYKSHVVWIADGQGSGCVPVVVDGMNSALGVAGSGDVLTGILGAFLAQGMDTVQAARAAVIVHQQAGKLAKNERGWFDSEELAATVGQSCQTFERSGL